MRIVSANVVDIKGGGAARIAFSLHRSLKKQGLDSTLLVQRKFSSEPGVIGPRSLAEWNNSIFGMYQDMLPLIIYPRWKVRLFYSSRTRGTMIQRINSLKPDVVILHSILRGFARVKDFHLIEAPVIWVFHDLWPLSGGCHYPVICEKWKTGCGKCPILGSVKVDDLSAKNWKTKQQAYEKFNFHIVSPGKWLADQIAASPLIAGQPVTIIPNGFDMELFYPRSVEDSRRKLNLPAEKKIILFGARNALLDKNKGIFLLAEALKLMPPQVKENSVLVTFGNGRPDKFFRNIFPVINAGFINSTEMMANLYSAADVMAVPSQQEIFGLVSLEAMACGTPVVACRKTGSADVIQDNVSGRLAEYDAVDFAGKLISTLDNSSKYSNNSIINARKYSLSVMTGKYIELIQKLV